MKKATFLISLIVCMVLVSAPAFGDGFKKSIGQTVYAAASHNCYFPDPLPEPPELQNCTLSVNTRIFIRNVNQNQSITITEFAFFDPSGAWAGDYWYLPVVINPLSSFTFAMPGDPNPSGFFIPYWGPRDGSPSYIIKWTAEGRVHPPLITSSTVFINRTEGQEPNPLSFQGLTVFPGVVLSEDLWDR